MTAMQKRSSEWLGWRPDLPDYRDEKFSFGRALTNELVVSSELPPRAEPQKKEVARHGVLDQGPTGSCTGHGVGLIAAVERNVTRRSPYFIYYEARRVIGETQIDEGAYIRDAIKVAGTLGAPTYRKWPSDVAKLHVDPIEAADRDAAKRKLFSYHRLRGRHEFLSCLASGHLFTIGFSVYSNIDDPLCERFGILGMPAGSLDGGHCVAVTGYDLDFQASEWAAWARKLGYPGAAIPREVYVCRNSWGEDWGNGGDFVVPCAFFEDTWLADDAWTVRGFEDEGR